jgi:hypothetical protein
MQSGNLNFLETSGPLQTCIGTLLPFLYAVKCELLNSIEQSFSWDVIKVSQLAEKFPEFYETPSFIIESTKALYLSLSWVRLIQSMPLFHFLKINFNFILPSTPSSSKWSLSLVFPHQNPLCMPPLPHTCLMPRPYHFKLQTLKLFYYVM